MANVRKGCVDVPQGEVHFRYGGSGPTVVLLHDSPRSSVVHVPNIEWLGEHFTVLALDTPGHGLSSPLPIDHPTIPDYSRALGDALTALGIERCAIYGHHNGAKIALQFAVDAPQRAALTIVDGLSLPVQMPEEDYLRQYLQSFAPTPEGDHIVRQWCRNLDIHRYYPWFTRDAGSRVARDLPDDRELHEYATDVFMASEHWPGAYGAALRHAALPVIAHLRSPTVIMCRQGDLLYEHLDRLPLAMPNGCRVARVADAPGAWRSQLLAALSDRTSAVASGWQAPPAQATASVHWRRHRYVNHLHGQVRVGLRGSATSQAPTLLLHDLPGTPRQLDGLAAELATDRLVVTLELPGLGESDPLPSPTLGAYVSVIDETLEALGCENVDVVAEGLGAAFACALAAN
ncbi:MAG TPA: alpha/beta fold hydrolase, partial [Steroidobacteraceae bacterium]